MAVCVTIADAELLHDVHPIIAIRGQSADLLVLTLSEHGWVFGGTTSQQTWRSHIESVRRRQTFSQRRQGSAK